LKSSTFGTGQLALDALNRGAQRIVIALGGSATVDGATGIAKALGFGLLDARGKPIDQGGGALGRLAQIVPPDDADRIRSVEWLALTDVANPLLGERGAARIFGPQKGASPSDVKTLEKGLERLASCFGHNLGQKVRRLTGSGAAGGAGAGLVGFLGANLVPGADWVLDTLGLGRLMGDADLLITGEGRLDSQSMEGKAPVSAARMARKAGVPAIALAGAVDLSASNMKKAGLTAAIPIGQATCTLEVAFITSEQTLPLDRRH
jgi:glycerate kinase